MGSRDGNRAPPPRARASVRAMSQQPGAGSREVRARASELVLALRTRSPSSEEVFAAFAELDALPPDVVREVLADWVGPAPDLDRLDDETRRAIGLRPRPLRLRTTSIVKDADVLDLGSAAEAQIV